MKHVTMTPPHRRTAVQSTAFHTPSRWTREHTLEARSGAGWQTAL